MNQVRLTPLIATQQTGHCSNNNYYHYISEICFLLFIIYYSVVILSPNLKVKTHHLNLLPRAQKHNHSPRLKAKKKYPSFSHIYISNHISFFFLKNIIFYIHQ